MHIVVSTGWSGSLWYFFTRDQFNTSICTDTALCVRLRHAHGGFGTSILLAFCVCSSARQSQHKCYWVWAFVTWCWSGLTCGLSLRRCYQRMNASRPWWPCHLLVCCVRQCAAARYRVMLHFHGVAACEQPSGASSRQNVLICCTAV